LTVPHLADIAQFYKRCCQLQLLLRSCLSSCQGPTAQLPQLQGLTVQRLSCWQLLREVAGVTKPAHRSIVGSIQQTREHNKVVTAFAWCSADAIQVAPVAKCIRPAEVSQASLYMVYVSSQLSASPLLCPSLIIHGPCYTSAPTREQLVGSCHTRKSPALTAPQAHLLVERHRHGMCCLSTLF
jgi:hypothetical protein